MRLHAPARPSRKTKHVRLRALLALFMIMTLGLSTGWSPAPVGAAPIEVNSLADNIIAGEGFCNLVTLENLTGPNDSEITLREAICAANNTPGPDIISFAGGLSGIILLDTEPGQLSITESLTINGPGESTLTIDAGDNSRIFSVESGPVVINNLTVTNGYASNGGCIFNVANLTLASVTITGCFTHSDAQTIGGGGIYNSDTGSLTLLDVTITQNVGVFGGGVLNVGTMTATDTTISENTDGKGGSIFGGGLYNGGQAELTDSTVSGNTAFFAGGGIYSGRDTLPIRGAAAAFALAAEEPTISLTLTNVTVSENSALDGGGVYIDMFGWQSEIAAPGETNIDSSTIDDNRACTGGGITNISDTLAIMNSTISKNFAGEDEEGISCEGPVYGGGIDSAGYFTLTNSTVSGNVTDGAGGGIAVEGYPAEITYSTITGNTADESGEAEGGGGIAAVVCVCPGPDEITTAEGWSYARSHRQRAASVAALVATDVALNSTIVAGNSGPDGLEDCGGGDLSFISSAGFNLFGTDTGCTANGTTDITTTAIATVLNTTLADNQGPTETHALVAGSAAIGKGDPTTCTTVAASRDQRTETRPSGVGCDIGSYELFIAAPSASASASASAEPLVTLTVQTTGDGEVDVTPAPVSSGGTPTNRTYQYAPDTVVTLTATPETGQIFARWTIDGTGALPYGRGWASPLTITLDDSHTAKADFAARPTFTDVPENHPYIDPIVELAARGIARGYTQEGCAELTPPVNAPCYGPDSPTLRMETALFLTRLLNLTGESHGNGGFSDVGNLTPQMQRAIGTMAHYDIFQGYGDGTFRPDKEITYAETILVISRAMVAKGYWTRATVDDPSIYPNLTVGRLSVVTFVQNAGPIPDFPNSTSQATLDQPAPRDWTAVVLWQTLNNYFSVDEPGKGGYVP